MIHPTLSPPDAHATVSSSDRGSHRPSLTIFYQFNPWNSTIGGIQTVIRSFIKYAPEHFDLQLVGTGDGREMKIGAWHDESYAGKKLRFMPVLDLPEDNVRGRIPTTVKYTAALMGKNIQSNFMHFHRLEPTLMARQWKADKTFFVHNDIHQQMAVKDGNNAILWRRFPQAYFAMEGYLVRQFDEVLSCNSESTALYQAQYPDIADRISFIRNTVDTEICQPLPPALRQAERLQLARELGLADNTQFLLFAGRLHPQKDPLRLVQALKALNQPNVHLLVAGDGELAPALKEEILRLHLSTQVTMLGAVDAVRLVTFYQVASALVLSSEFEGLPLVVLEALACGTPIVSTRCGETPNFLTSSSGVISPDRSPLSIARSIQQVLDHPEQYPSSACSEVAAPYSARTVVTQVYESMLQRWKR
jgi:glycosyltransferase involved in cell wall biosynthesis